MVFLNEERLLKLCNEADKYKLAVIQKILSKDVNFLSKKMPLFIDLELFVAS
jgi:hypothetical protein